MSFNSTRYETDEHLRRRYELEQAAQDSRWWIVSMIAAISAGIGLACLTAGFWR